MQEILLNVSDFIPDFFAGKTWQSVPANPAGLNLIHHTAVADDINFYAIGGIISDVARNRLHRYNLDTNQWTVMATIPASKYAHASCLYNGEIYVFGGALNISVTQTNTVYKYNIANNTWSQLNNLPFLGNFIDAVIVGNKIYICTGETSVSPSEHIFYEYNPANDTYTHLPDPPFLARRGAGVAAMGTDIYIIGGLAGSTSVAANYRKDFWKYDTLTQQWTQLDTFTANMIYRGSLSKYDNDHLMLIGGVQFVTNQNTINTMQLYNTKTNKWKVSSGVLPQRTHYNYPIRYRNQIIVTNGWISTNGTPTYSANCYRLPLS